MDEIGDLAARWGIETGYFDIQGQWQEASPETIRRIAAALSEGGTPRRNDPNCPAIHPAFQGDGRRGWIIAVQLYAVRSRRNWGHGDFTDLAALIELPPMRGQPASGSTRCTRCFPICQSRPARTRPAAGCS